VRLVTRAAVFAALTVACVAPGPNAWGSPAAAQTLAAAQTTAATPQVAGPSAAASVPGADVQALLAPWGGPYGGWPPFDKAKPATIAEAYEAAIATWRNEVRAIASNPAPPTFDNTIVALEDSGRAVKRVEPLLRVFASTMNTGEMREVEKRLAPLLSAVQDEIAHDAGLSARIEAVFASADATGLSAEQRRLTQVVRTRRLRRGAGLPAEARTRLAEINARIAALQARYTQNMIADQDSQVVWLEDEADLAGLSPELRTALAAAAKAKGRSDRWAVANSRPLVWPFLTTSPRRDLREKVWRMWTSRGDHPGEHDNKPVATEILRLRGEKARLLGFPTFAHFATADRMARTPDAAIALLQQTWARVIGPTRALIADLQAMADADGTGITLAPWDRLYYTDRLRRTRFGVDTEAVRPYLEAESVRQAIFWAAGRLHGLTFKEVPDAPVCHPDVRVFEVSRRGEAIGLVWWDLFRRPGKMPGSWSGEYRSAESFRGRVLPIAALYSNVDRPASGGPALLTWEVANVLFHEMGHVLHFLANTTSYPSLGSLTVPWDFVEVPSLVNERWFYDRDLLARFARHHATGEPMPVALVEKIERTTRFDRVFSLNLDYLAPAIVDMRMHLLADGRDVDAVALERQVLEELGMPAAWDEIMRVTHSVHSFSDEYAAGVYVYLWADVMAADIAEAFVQSPGGLYDERTAERWRTTVLGVGSRVPAEEAFRNFRGRDPDAGALFRRFGLDAPAVPRAPGGAEQPR
jgi:peptidyl-dipeptidase Dcp